MRKKTDFYRIYFEQLARRGFQPQRSDSADYIADIYHKGQLIAYYTKADTIAPCSKTAILMKDKQFSKHLKPEFAPNVLIPRIPCNCLTDYISCPSITILLLLHVSIICSDMYSAPFIPTPTEKPKTAGCSITVILPDRTLPCVQVLWMKKPCSPKQN